MTNQFFVRTITDYKLKYVQYIVGNSGTLHKLNHGSFAHKDFQPNHADNNSTVHHSCILFKHLDRTQYKLTLFVSSCIAID